MSVETFQYLLDLTGINLKRLDIRFQRAIEIDKRLATVKWRLSTENTYRSVSKIFVVRKSTVIKIFQDGINHIVQLAPTFIKFPDTALETSLATTLFQDFIDSTMPQVVGAVDGTYIEILAPLPESKLDTFHKTKVHHKFTGCYCLKFMLSDVLTGFPGSLNDARIIFASTLFQKCEG